jgi:hypothetical protein
MTQKQKKGKDNCENGNRKTFLCSEFSHVGPPFKWVGSEFHVRSSPGQGKFSCQSSDCSS